MSKEKLETGAMLNPDCQKCHKKDKCNNKTLCAYLIPKDVHIDKVAADIQEPIQMPIIFTPEMLQKEINRSINESLSIGVDFGKGCSISSMRGMR